VIVRLPEEAFLVAVRRSDGVARMTSYLLDRAQAIALARAIAAPD